MNHREIVQIAVRCLAELEGRPHHSASFKEISRKQGIPLAECVRVLRQLYAAGIVTLEEAGKVTLQRSMDELTALDILQAVWAKNRIRPAFQMWVGADRGPAAHKTLEFVRWARLGGKEAYVNG
jgi:DNA-binding IscR family transcriptional regulator